MGILEKLSNGPKRPNKVNIMRIFYPSNNQSRNNQMNDPSSLFTDAVSSGNIDDISAPEKSQLTQLVT